MYFILKFYTEIINPPLIFPKACKDLWVCICEGRVLDKLFAKNYFGIYTKFKYN